MMYDVLKKSVVMPKSEWNQANYRNLKRGLTEAVQDAIMSFSPLNSTEYTHNPIQLPFGTRRFNRISAGTRSNPRY